MTEAPDSPRRRVVIAEATGFIGTALCKALAPDFDVIALTRSPTRGRRPDPHGQVQWLGCDFFASRSVEIALEGCDYAIYLASGLEPAALLTQASTRDLDLVMADYFARAAARTGVKQIITIGSLIPDGFRISPNLSGKREVELTLASYKTPVTALRAGLVVGPGGMNTQMLVDMVRQTPLLLLPRKAGSLTRPIALNDLIRAIRHCLGNPQSFTGPFDIGGAEWVSHEGLLRECAETLGVHRAILSTPLMPDWLATRMTRLLNRAPGGLVDLMSEMMQEDARFHENPLQEHLEPEVLDFRQALEESLSGPQRQTYPNPRHITQQRDRQILEQSRLVRSVHRVVLPPGRNTSWLASSFFQWLGSCCGSLFRVEFERGGRCNIRLRSTGTVLIQLKYSASNSDRRRQMYRIVGGRLCHEKMPSTARLEFQTVLGKHYTMIGVHDYMPALPWPVYRSTQALWHRWIMRRYQRRLATLIE